MSVRSTFFDMNRISDLLALERPLVMGILNVTPDSFHDGGNYSNTDAALDHAWTMIEDGTDIIDIGGESTRPGADPVPVEEELSRILPVIEGIRERHGTAISVDTSNAETISAAAGAGADLINDVRALRREGAVTAAARTGLPVCLMHMKGDPKTMQLDPRYDDLIGEINAFFRERIEACVRAGIEREKLILDPGFGFGKTPEHNLRLINRLDAFREAGLPLLVGLSRKSTIGRILEGVSEDRWAGSVAGAVIAAMKGASILRVHDVKPTVEALRVTTAFMNEALAGENSSGRGK